MSYQEIAAFISPPFANVTGLRCLGNIAVSNAGVSQSLSAWYGAALGLGEFLMVQADGAKVYVHFSPNSTTSIDAFATGVGPNLAWPIPDGVTVSVIPGGGRLVGTGIATTMVPHFLHAKVASGGVATAYLRAWRGYGPTRDLGALKGP